MSLTRFNRLLSRHAAVQSARLTAGRPIASITFDDFPKSAWALGGPVLARYKARGPLIIPRAPFAAAPWRGSVFYDAEDLNALKAAGHEIACHGFAHQPTPSLSSQRLAEDAARNAEFLKPFLDGGPAESYAFPYGLASPRTKRFYASRFTNVRGVHPGLNSGRADLALLNAISMETALLGRATRSRAPLSAPGTTAPGLSSIPMT